MSLKRIRNKKIEAQVSYPISLIDLLDQEKLQDHVQASLNTGMEDEEKEELHLKNILKTNKGEILTPEIIKLNFEDTEIDSQNAQPFKKSKLFIRYQEDCKNEYIFSEEDIEFIASVGITNDYFIEMIEKLREENEKKMKVKKNESQQVSIDLLSSQNDRKEEIIKSYIQKRILLLFDENCEFNKYACFRKRILKAGRKSRRSEAFCIEKMKKMLTEVSLIERLYELIIKKYKEELNLNSLKGELVNLGKTAVNLYPNLKKYKKKITRKIINPIIGKKVETISVPFYKNEKFDELINDRKKINQLKKMFSGKRPSETEIDSTLDFLKNVQLL